MKILIQIRLAVVEKIVDIYTLATTETSFIKSLKKSTSIDTTKISYLVKICSSYDMP